MRTVECNKDLPLEPGPQQEEKKASETSLDCQHSSDLEERLDPEKAEEEGREADQVEPSTLQESPGARAEAVFLQDVVRCTHHGGQPVQSSLSQRLLVELKAGICGGRRGNCLRTSFCQRDLRRQPSQPRAGS